MDFQLVKDLDFEQFDELMQKEKKQEGTATNGDKASKPLDSNKDKPDAD